ncbi:MAG: hypothetical protein WCD62_00195, partial [Pseudolabrys sp.]
MSKARRGAPADGTYPSDVERLRNFEAAFAGLGAAEPITLETINEIALLPVVSKKRANCTAGSRQFGCFAAQIGSAIWIEGCAVIG